MIVAITDFFVIGVPGAARADSCRHTLRVDATAARRQAHLDGKWLLRTSDHTFTPEDLQLRDLSQRGGVRPGPGWRR